MGWPADEGTQEARTRLVGPVITDVSHGRTALRRDKEKLGQL
jgi:hypothetical protein